MPKTITTSGKRYPLGMRTTKAVREKLERAAAEAGRSLAQEVEFRLELSFHTDRIVDETVRRLVRNIGRFSSPVPTWGVKTAALLEAEPSITIDNYRFRHRSKILQDDHTGRKIRLTEKEAELLKLLHQANNHAVGKDTLLDEIWGYNNGVTSHTLETHVYRLRQKIERDPSRPEIIVSAPDGGYRLVQ